ncbi:MAG: GNAT family N-acetyltransferase [Ahrensia sp.]
MNALAQSHDHENQKQFSLHTPVLSTRRLVLRAPILEDIDDLVTLANDQAIAEMTSRLPYPYTLQDAQRYVGAVLDGSSIGHIYAITLADTGRLIGMCSVEMRARSNGLEVGYWIGRNWWGKGYATEASSAVVDLAFKVTGTDAIFAACRVNNAGSRRVLMKQGFIFAGLDEVDTVASGRVTIERYRVTREDWLAHIARS